jgi:hypothetical protein
VVFLVCSARAVSTARAFIRILSVPTDFGHYTPEIGRFLHTERISTATLVTVAFSAETVVESRAPGVRLSRRVISFSWPDFQTFSHSLRPESAEDLPHHHLLTQSTLCAVVRRIDVWFCDERQPTAQPVPDLLG